MTTIGMHYDVIPGKEEEFERGFVGVIEHLKHHPEALQVVFTKVPPGNAVGDFASHVAVRAKDVP